MSRSMAQLFLLCLCALVAAHAQQVIQVSGRAIQQHVDHQVFPVYPPIARAARVHGTVVLDLRIGTKGKIESLKVVSGPPMLRQAAIECLKQWTFHPFEKDGVPVVATGRYNISFTLGDQSNTAVGQGSPSSASPTSSAPVKTATVRVLSDNAATGPDKELNKEFDDTDGACKKGILSRKFNGATISACKNAAELAERLPMEGNWVAKRSAFVYAATAYWGVGNFKSALPWADKAVEVVKLGHDDTAGGTAAYSTKGAIEGMVGDLTDSDRDLTAAEDLSRKGITRVEKEAPSLRHEYVGQFVRELQFHAKVLQAMGRSDEALKKLDEAAKYISSNR